MTYYDRKNRATWAVIRLVFIHGPWICALMVALDALGLL